RVRVETGTGVGGRPEPGVFSLEDGCPPGLPVSRFLDFLPIRPGSRNFMCVNPYRASVVCTPPRCGYGGAILCPVSVTRRHRNRTPVTLTWDPSTGSGQDSFRTPATTAGQWWGSASSL